MSGVVIPMPDRVGSAIRVANEIRGHMARQRWTARAMSDRLGYNRTTFHRRMNGEVPFNVAELDQIAAVLGVDPVVFLSPPPGGSGPPGGGQLPRLDSNQEPAGYRSAQVIALHTVAS